MFIKALVLLCVITVASVLSRPHKAKPLTGLDDITNRTICPIEVEVNIRATRIPRRIKYIKCAEPGKDICKGPFAIAACCDVEDSACEHTYRCEQIEDAVLVGNVHNDSLNPEMVSVGCALVKRSRLVAEELD